MKHDQNIRQIVNDYQVAKTGWFDLFQIRADDAVIECRNLLHSMAEGYMVADLRGPFTYGDDAVLRAERSLKAVAAADSGYWRTPHAERYLEANKKAIDDNKVQFTRIFVQPRETLYHMIDILEKQKEMGIEVYVACTEFLPDNLNEDYLIMDDRVLMTLRLTGDGHPKGEEITIDPVQVERMVKTFNVTLRYAKKLDEIIGELKGSKKESS